MVRSELIDKMTREFSHLPSVQVELMVNGILNVMVKTLMDDGRIEIRGFGTWCLRKRRSRNAHNPRTGKTIKTPEKYGVYFKAGKSLRERVHAGKMNPIYGMRKGDSEDTTGESVDV